MDKEDVVQTYNGIFLIHLEEWNDAIFSNMEIIILGEVRDRQICDTVYIQNL